MLKLFRKILLLGLLTGVVTGHATDSVLTFKLDEAETQVKKIEKTFLDEVPTQEISLLDEFQEQLQTSKKTANECVETTETAIEKNANDLELLGPEADLEETVVIDKRKSLNDSMLKDAQQLASCRLLLLRVNDLQDTINDQRQRILAGKLLAQSNHVLTNISDNLVNSVDLYEFLLTFIQTKSLYSFMAGHLVIVMMLALSALGFTWLIKKWLKGSLKRHQKDEQTGYLSQFQLSFLTCFNRYLVVLMLSGFLSAFYIYQYFKLDHIEFLGLIIIGIFIYSLFNLSIRILLNPCPPGQKLSNLPEEISLILARRLKLLSKLLLVGYLLYTVSQLVVFPEYLIGLARNIYLFLLISNLVWAVWLFRYYESVSNIHFIRAIIIMGFVVSLVADWLGYINLSNFILVSILGSMVLWSLTIFITRIWSDLLDSLDEGRHQWQRSFRKRIGVKDKGFIPGSFWFRLTFALMIWSLFLVGFLKIWGMPDANLLALRDYVTDGFEVGTIKIVPIKFITAFLTFAVLLSIIGWIKRRMDKSWLKHSRMNAASKESMISISGYVGVAIATLIVLSIAGVELSNIALVAGALSVGIGFGLQNIVNNFISGIILLFERPIKTGDWIAVGPTQGYVKKISIRSTQIQTFDRSDVIVPNSELISTQVTNWMFKDRIARVIAPIGVAYGTDPQQVKEILLDIAHSHEAVITQSPIIPKPWVFFSAFGDSSLNFELRCYIRNADKRLSVLSDFNFAIEAALRDANIVIPFPQRDVHLIRDNDDLMVNSDDIKS